MFRLPKNLTGGKKKKNLTEFLKFIFNAKHIKTI